MANLTSATLGAADAAVAATPTFFVSVIASLWDIISAPLHHTHMQWIVIPLVVTFCLTEFYFFRHPDEELGWNAALMNSLVLVFIAIDLTKTIFHEQPPLAVARLFLTSLSTGEHLSSFLVISFIGCLGLFLAIVNYFHMLPRRIAFIISSHPIINYIAYVAIVIVYSEKAGDPVALGAPFVIAATAIFTAFVYLMFRLQTAFGTLNYSQYRRS